jgi:hypothetical protein
MAITWGVKITVLDYAQRHVSVAATRTDSAKPEDPRTYTVSPCHIDTTGQKTALLDKIWEKRTVDVALDAKVAVFAPTIASLESAAKTNLEGREV